MAVVTMAVAAATAAAAQEPPAPASWRETFTSARVDALRSEAAAGRADTEAFWRLVEREGTPLLEPSAADARHQVVTFLWRGTAETRRVLVELYPYTWERAGDYAMRHVAGTDVWYLTARLPRGARFIYRISPDDPLDNPASGVLRRTNFQSDPHNPDRWLCPPAAAARQCYSRVELPGAAPQPWLDRKPGTPAGAVERHRFRSALLNNERDVSVYTPPGYRRTARGYPTLILFDGGAYQNAIPTPAIVDNLIAAGKIPPVIAVFVANVPGAREAELLFNRLFIESVATELVPWLRARYPVSTDPRRTIVGGLSAGGAAAAYAALLRPDIFGNVIAQSGAFNASPAQLKDWQERTPADAPGDRHVQEEVEDRSAVEGEWLAALVIEQPRRPIRFYLDAGLFEASVGGVVGILDATRHMRDVLRAKGYEVHYQMFVGGHDYLSWRGTLADGLIALLGAARR